MNGPLVLPLLGEVVARLPLSPQDWHLLPSPCPGLAAALPAVLQRSEAEAGHLVALLSPVERARLRLLALCLSRASQGKLPVPISHRILALAAAMQPWGGPDGGGDGGDSGGGPLLARNKLSRLLTIRYLSIPRLLHALLCYLFPWALP